jgi:phosphoenolpyruvate phosphomutase
MEKNMKNSKKVYLGMCADIVHHGHINIIKEASKLGSITVGLLTDKAIATYKRIPILSYEERKQIVENIKGVEKVIPQNTLSYRSNLVLEKPDYVVHGDDWKSGPQENIRKEVIETINEWQGELIEIPYTKNVSSTSIQNKIKQINSPQRRTQMLRRLIKSKDIVRIIEAHNGLTGLMVETITANTLHF